MPGFGFDGQAQRTPATISRRRAVGRLGATLVTVPIASARAGRATAAQGQETEIGRAPAGQQAFRLVGTIEQRGFDFTAHGFVLQMADLDAAALFINDDAFNRSAATARLTFQAAATATARAIHHPLFAVEATGSMTFHLNQLGGAAFDDPESFAAGTEVAAAGLAVSNVVNVQQPQVGIMSGFADLAFETSDPFTLDDSEYVLGGSGLTTRMSLVGQGTLLDPALPEAVLRFVGDAVTVA